MSFCFLYHITISLNLTSQSLQVTITMCSVSNILVFTFCICVFLQRLKNIVSCLIAKIHFDFCWVGVGLSSTVISVAFFFYYLICDYESHCYIQVRAKRKIAIYFTSLFFVHIVHKEVCYKGIHRMFLVRFSYEKRKSKVTGKKLQSAYGVAQVLKKLQS
jgi:hypothetical protein